MTKITITNNKDGLVEGLCTGPIYFIRFGAAERKFFRGRPTTRLGRWKLGVKGVVTD
jgi:hypothetical protein